MAARDTNSDWFGHPPQLARLFTTEMWERFGFYGMRAVLILYLTKHFVFGDETANGLYGAFTSLVYLTPLFGGILADRYLGYKHSVKLGAILMSIGYFALCFGGQPGEAYLEFDGRSLPVVIEQSTDPQGQVSETRSVKIDGDLLRIEGQTDGSMRLVPDAGSDLAAIDVARDGFRFGGRRNSWFVSMMFLSLSCIILGNGFFKPNISTMVGSLYARGDTRRDAGFTIFYMGINIGAMLAQILCPMLAETIGPWAGFGLAALGMFAAYLLIQFDGGRLDGYGEAPANASSARPWIYVGTLLVTPLIWFLLNNTLQTTEGSSDVVAQVSGAWQYIVNLPVLGKVLSVIFFASVIGIPLWSISAGTREESLRMIAASILVVFSVVFWTLFEQAGSSLTLFADRNTDRHVLGWEMPAGQVQVFNAIFIVLLAPVFSFMWMWLGKRGWEPSIPVKFAMALAFVGLGFLALVYGSRFADANYRIGLIWLVLAYLIHSIGELCLSPVGLSMITKLSMPRVVGLMMGVWFISAAMAQYIAGIIAQFASVETVGGKVTNLQGSLQTYTGVFSTIGWAAVGFGVVLLVVSPLLKRMIRGVA
jgi:POT family proton-dependent oligopeptide transporter